MAVWSRKKVELTCRPMNPTAKEELAAFHIGALGREETGERTLGCLIPAGLRLAYARLAS